MSRLFGGEAREQWRVKASDLLAGLSMRVVVKLYPGLARGAILLVSKCAASLDELHPTPPPLDCQRPKLSLHNDSTLRIYLNTIERCSIAVAI